MAATSEDPKAGDVNPKQTETGEEEARKRDHRYLGQRLDLFFFHSEVSAGSAFWLPHGAKLYNKLQALIRTEYVHRGYQEVHSPNLYNCDLFKVSGHMANYRECMFLLSVEDKEWGLKPMNCPGHCLIFRHLHPTYKQLPLRLADFGVLHRNEFSGALTGLTRVRRFQQDDAHIFCALDDVHKEVFATLQFIMFVYKLFDFKFELFLSTKPEKALGAAELWTKAEKQLASALDEFGLPWSVNEGDGAFYGPKIDIVIHDAIGRKQQCGTIQLDFQLPLRFDLTFRTSEVADSTLAGAAEESARVEDGASALANMVNQDWSMETPLHSGYERPVMIHRAIFGSFERFTAVILEHTGGKLPFWASPRQALVVPISEKNMKYATYVHKIFQERGYDVGIDATSNTLKKKIRDGIQQQWNYLLVVGHQETANRTLMVRNRDSPDEQRGLSIPEVLSLFKDLNNPSKRSFEEIPPFEDE